MKAQGNRLDNSGQGVENSVDFLGLQTNLIQVFGPRQYCFVLEYERNRSQHREPPFKRRQQELAGGASIAPHGSDDDIRIENEPHPI